MESVTYRKKTVIFKKAIESLLKYCAVQYSIPECPRTVYCKINQSTLRAVASGEDAANTVCHTAEQHLL